MSKNDKCNNCGCDDAYESYQGDMFCETCFESQQSYRKSSRGMIELEHDMSDSYYDYPGDDCEYDNPQFHM